MEKYYLSQLEQGILFECLEPTTKYNLPSLMPLGEKLDVENLRKGSIYFLSFLASCLSSFIPSLSCLPETSV